MSKKTAILIKTTRGGKDPDVYWCAVTADLARKLPRFDVWAELGNFIDAKDAGVLSAFAETRKIASDAAKKAGFVVQAAVWEAIGY
jgi:hypothetical protein